MFCRKCGHEMPDDSIFCGKCGFNQNTQFNSSPQSHEMGSQNNSSPSHDSASDRSKSVYFDHSTLAITILVVVIALILAVSVIVTMIVNGEITELEEYHSHRFDAEISHMKSIRNWNIFFDALLIGGLLWRCYLTNKNYLRVTGNVLDGVCCPPFGFTTTDVHDLKVEDIVAIEAKNNHTLVVTLDRDHIFLIENAEDAYWMICKKMRKE